MERAPQRRHARPAGPPGGRPVLRAVLLGALLLAAAAPARAQTGEDPRQVVGPPRGQRLSGEQLETRTRQVASLLRCPVCQGLSVADSPSSTAVNMKDHVRQLLSQGYDEDQVLAYFERSYGEFVRLMPARRGVNWLVWIAPVVGLLLGVAVVLLVLRSPRARPGPEPGPAGAPVAETGRDRLPEDARLAGYVLKARELAYGWVGGVPPRRGDP